MNTAYINYLYKASSRAEIRNYRAGKVSDENMDTIANNNIGQNERAIEHIGSGSLQNATKVNLPGHGIAVRKSQQYQMPAEDYVNHPDFKVVNALQHYQQGVGHGGGFAKVLHTDSKTGLHFHELVKGKDLMSIGKASENIPYEQQEALAANVKSVLNGTDPNPHRAHFLGVSPDIEDTVTHLKKKFPDTWDYAKPDNLVASETNGKIHTIKSIDLQGGKDIAINKHLSNLRGGDSSRLAHLASGSYATQNPNWQFQERKGQSSVPKLTYEQTKAKGEDVLYKEYKEKHNMPDTKVNRFTDWAGAAKTRIVKKPTNAAMPYFTKTQQEPNAHLAPKPLIENFPRRTFPSGGLKGAVATAMEHVHI